MERTDNKGDHYISPVEDWKEISTLLAFIQDILSQLKTNNQHKKTYKLDSGQIRKDNEILRNGLSVLEKVMHASLEV